MSNMMADQSIRRELGLSEVISKSFELFRKDFAKYFILFAVVETIVGVATALARSFFVLPTIGSNPTPQEVFNWLPGFLGILLLLIGTIFIVTVVFFPIAQGSAIRMASEQIEKGQAELGPSISFAASKLLSIWALTIVVGILVILGFIAVIVPGIILAIMFALAFPVLMIENKGVFESMGRSRQLVSNRWLKTLATFIVMGIILGIASAIVSAISAPFGAASPVVNGLLSAFYQPLFPIFLTIYYYSNLARLVPVTIGQENRLARNPAAA